jgi:hypothetical protein
MADVGGAGLRNVVDDLLWSPAKSLQQTPTVGYSFFERVHHLD